MRQGEKPGDVVVPLLPGVNKLGYDAAEDQRRRYIEMMTREATRHSRISDIPFRDILVTEPKPRRRSLHQRFEDWWCSHASDFSRGH